VGCVYLVYDKNQWWIVVKTYNLRVKLYNLRVPKEARKFLTG